MLSGKDWKHDLLLVVSLVMSFRSRLFLHIYAYIYPITTSECNTDGTILFVTEALCVYVYTYMYNQRRLELV